MDLNIQKKKQLKNHTTLQVGGDAEYYVEVDSEAALEKALLHARENDLAVTLLGSGSNVLISNGGISGLVIHMAMRGITAEAVGTKVSLTVGAGELLDDAVQYAVTQGYWGIENLSHIPGTAGAAPVQNVGAYGVEIQDCIEKVRVYNTQTCQFQELTTNDCQFDYRDSVFKTPEGKKYILVSVTFILTTEVTQRLTYKDLKDRFAQNQPALQEVRDAVIEIRSKKFPDWKTIGTVGSFFKNPVVSRVKFEELRTAYPALPGFDAGTDSVKIPLGWILDKVLHLKGEGNQKVGTYQGQSLVLINKGTATADDFICFADDIAQKVLDATGITIQWEVTKLGF